MNETLEDLSEEETRCQGQSKSPPSRQILEQRCEKMEFAQARFQASSCFPNNVWASAAKLRLVLGGGGGQAKGAAMICRNAEPPMSQVVSPRIGFFRGVLLLAESIDITSGTLRKKAHGRRLREAPPRWGWRGGRMAN